ncbi:hypothetical protein D3877_15650 [Azospirillum cavernae]|uniref:Uncharacterized protein n=1 Tax=Azospirillum cavernae TaxID=2320860 RepID=A0A418VWQ3_9PROT|nr:hypothetical protein D3877_15650 [Azospirillum cavernae]
MSKCKDPAGALHFDTQDAWARPLAGFCIFLEEENNEVVSAAGFEPTAPGFIPLRLSPPPLWGVRGLDCPFALGPKARRRRPSSLYTFPLAGAWLGIGMTQARRSVPRL